MAAAPPSPLTERSPPSPPLTERGNRLCVPFQQRGRVQVHAESTGTCFRMYHGRYMLPHVPPTKRRHGETRCEQRGRAGVLPTGLRSVPATVHRIRQMWVETHLLPSCTVACIVAPSQATQWQDRLNQRRDHRGPTAWRANRPVLLLVYYWSDLLVYYWTDLLLVLQRGGPIDQLGGPMQSSSPLTFLSRSISAGLAGLVGWDTRDHLS